MPIEPDQRQHLAAVMEGRRLELRLTWQEVAERGDISLRALSSARAGSGDIRPLTRRGIDKGLQWVEGSGVDNILAGKAPRTVELGPVLPITANSARAVGIDVSDPGDPWISAVREQVDTARAIHGDDPAGAQIFAGAAASNHEAGLWDYRELSEADRIAGIAILRAMTASTGAGQQNPGRSGRAGLVLAVTTGGT